MMIILRIYHRTKKLIEDVIRVQKGSSLVDVLDTHLSVPEVRYKIFWLFSDPI